MDGHDFDNLTRRLATGTSRRGLLRGLAGGSIAGLLTALGGRPAGAAGKKVPICHRTSSATNPYVYILVSDNPNGPHSKHQGDVIDVNLQINPHHCGACGQSCPADQCNRATCTGGVCGMEPDRIGQACDDDDPCTDGDLCQADGTCQGTPKACPPCQACQGGACVTVADDTVCGTDQKCCGGTCTDVATTADCGACGHACAAGETCHLGACEPCGGLDQACCAGSTCDPHLTCSLTTSCDPAHCHRSTCQDCGEVGEACCLTFGFDFCNTGARCRDVGGQRQCAACGGTGQVCCPFAGQECGPGLTCDFNQLQCVGCDVTVDPECEPQSQD